MSQSTPHDDRPQIELAGIDRPGIELAGIELAGIELADIDLQATDLQAIEQPDADAFRRAMGRFATGVAMLTTRSRGVDLAMTASALTSVSLDPLLLLVCVEREGRFHDAVLDAGIWGISVLSGGDRPGADWLATRGRPLHGQLDRIAHHHGPQTGVALLNEALSAFECRTIAVHPAGDHSIVVGEVVSVAAVAHPGEALVYYRGRYGTLP